MTQEQVSTAGDPETPPAAAPWPGRLLLLVGVVLLGLSLRHAITAVSPLLSTIQDDIELGTAGATILGMLPTVAFGVAGFATPIIIRRLGLPLTAVVALGLGAAGTLIRVLGDSSALFLIFGAVALFGMGMGNVVGPPLVKRYFPDRQGAVMSAFVLTMQAGATIPAMLTLPLANAGGWRFAVGSWALLMVLAALPWVGALVKDRGRTEAASAAEGRSGFGLSTLIRNPVSIGGALFYGMAALNTYALLAWLPVIFQSLGLSQGEAGRMYAIYTFLTLPMALVAPILATRMRNPLPFGVLLSLVAAIGYLGIILAPISTAAVWVFIAGIGGGAFPFALTMFNLRTRTTQGSAAVTGFALGCGYAFGRSGRSLAACCPAAPAAGPCRCSCLRRRRSRWWSAPCC
ncbi:MFS transporter [Sphingosinicella sp. LY1275]|uniref:MFS transporter n=1 Tax=Sphingosinicella sp. LY1275 TaxID=3095379 RepID=UPI002ADEED84|nr:MFS transporter [Sphingosinicella sp. LY1275]MEA1013703.1 MFS transporter [Sphingosinicella sp. LY1275]